MEKIFITWSADDILAKAKEMGATITKYEAIKILYNVGKYHDASIGINWDVIAFHIDEFILERQHETINSKAWFEHLAK